MTEEFGNGRNLETVFTCPGDLLHIYRCKDCGTVIYGSDDCYKWEENLRCPTCTNYETAFKYYTKVDIEMDDKIAREIAFYEKWQDDVDAQYEWEKKHGRSIHEVWKKVIETEKRKITFAIKCDDVREKKHANRYFYIRYSTPDALDGVYIVRHQIRIPLSWSHFNTYCLYRIKRRLQGKDKNELI